MAASEKRIRIHITPFNPSLLDRYLPATIKPLATNISFHTVETFPEKGFGYVELPSSEAAKLKNRLGGMTLKGAKVRIEVARPEKKRKIREEDEDGEKKTKKVKKVKVKKEEGVLKGFELPEGRSVKRGWTEEKSGEKGKHGPRKKDREGKTMKFKTRVPIDAVPVESADNKKKKSKTDQMEKTKEEKVEKAERRARKKEALVKEFANTTTLSFPNSAGDKKVKHYEEGVGWVDEEGDVLEPEPSSAKRKREKEEKKEKTAAKKILTPEPAESAPAESESDEDEDVQVEEAVQPPPTTTTASEDSSEHSSAESESGAESLNRNLNKASSNTLANTTTSQPLAPGELANPVPVGDVVEEVDELDTSIAKEVHPLEAIYKRTDTKPAPIDTSFNFFAAASDDDVSDNEDTGNVSSMLAVPQTPHAKEDLEWRGVRSAAPTPDTAAIEKKFVFPVPDPEEEEEEESGEMDGKGEESEFRKWFYANRGELSRGWKKRRREERKVVRQRENRRVGRRVA